MATASLRELVAAMADQIRDAMDIATTGTDLNVQVEPRRMAAPTSPPTIDIYLADDSRSVDGAGMGSVSGLYRFTVRARIDTGDVDATQDILLELADDESPLCLAQALYDEPTLGGLATDLTIESFSGHRQYADPGGTGAFLGMDWTVSVHRAYS